MAALILPETVSADEGMWLLGRTDPKAMAVARQLGLQLTDEQLYGEDGTSLKDCVVDFSDYCSGVIVSADGLLFTNHHCGFSAIQRLSTVDDDILNNGFVARSHEEERPAEGIFVKVWLRTEDITATIQHQLDSIYATDKDVDREALYAENIDMLLDTYALVKEQECEEAGQKGIVCDAKSFYGGTVFLLNYYRQYSDVRLVFTVPQSLGKFGGDTDNWMWPRQTADFSVFRIYTDSLGQPAEYSPSNIPMKPTRWAKVSLDGYQPGSYCMTIGYPGSTNRYLSSYGINERVNVINIPMIQVRGIKQDIWTRWMRADRAVGIKYASKHASSANYWKNSQGMNEAVRRLGIIEQKQQREQQLQEWFSANEQLNARFGNVYSSLEKAYSDRRESYSAMCFLNETFLRGIEIVRMAARAKALLMRSGNDRLESTPETEEFIREMYKDYDPRVDEEVMAALLANYSEQVGPRYYPAIYSEIETKFNGDYAAYARYVFENSKLTTLEGARSLLMAKVRWSNQVETADSAELEEQNRSAFMARVDSDPAVQLYASVMIMVREEIAPTVMETEYTIQWNENLLTQAVLEYEQNQPHYSDANFTQRMSFGIVSDYTNGDIHNEYYTTMPSLIEKIETGSDNPDYAMQSDVLSLLKSGDYGRYADPTTGQMQLCFLTTNDITGGNSGSPMFNGKGELIGLAFDGNWDALSSDISFDPAMTRCIGVDIRFVMWLIDKWGRAENLVKEVVE
ncbi:MAG: S46 family peptidase [Bacteroidaceae bacterium]|nr:S46 family peptidase [Bacteroidaceae bacterium]